MQGEVVHLGAAVWAGDRSRGTGEVGTGEGSGEGTVEEDDDEQFSVVLLSSTFKLLSSR